MTGRSTKVKDQIILYDTLFDFDLDGERFVDVRNRLNVIHFSRFKKDGDFMVILYDTDTRNVHKGWNDPEALDGFGFLIKIPAPLFRRVNPLEEHEIQAINAASYAGKYLFHFLDGADRNRIGGKRPVVNVEGDRFRFIREREEMELIGANKRPMSTRYFKEVEGLKSWEFIYDTKQKNVGKITNLNGPFPKHMVLVRIPNGIRLDPVGEALQWHKLPVDLLVKFPYRAEVTARVVPWDMLKEAPEKRIGAVETVEKPKQKEQNQRRKRGNRFKK